MIGLPCLGHGFDMAKIGFTCPLGPVGYPLPAYADGGYPLVYLDAKNRCLCSACCNDPECELGPAVLCDVHWEGEPLECEACGAEIASAYGSTEEIVDERAAEDWEKHSE